MSLKRKLSIGDQMASASTARLNQGCYETELSLTNHNKTKFKCTIEQ